jgi:hypothetical protein
LLLQPFLAFGSAMLATRGHLHDQGYLYVKIKLAHYQRAAEAQPERAPQFLAEMGSHADDASSSMTALPLRPDRDIA